MPKNSEIDALNAVMPARRARAVVPANGAALVLGVCDSLWINDDGLVDVSVVAEDDGAAIVYSVRGPGPLPIRAKTVEATGTTATDIVAIY